MEFLEKRFPAIPMLPDNTVMAALAHLIHSYGSEGLLKPAMYYRWNTTLSNRRFIINEFSRSSETKDARDANDNKKGRHQADYFRGFLQPLGIGLANDVDIAIEESTGKLYANLNEHFLSLPLYIRRSTVFGRLWNDGAIVCPPWSRSRFSRGSKTANARSLSLD